MVIEKKLLFIPKITFNSRSTLRKNCSVGTIKSERDWVSVHLQLILKDIKPFPFFGNQGR